MSNMHDIPVGRYALAPIWRLGKVIRLLSIYLGLPLSILVEQAKHAARIFPDSWNKFHFRRFWGEKIAYTGVYLVIENYENLVLRNRFRWAESGHKHPNTFSGEVIQGTFSPQATAMLTALFLRYTGKGPRIATDIEVASQNGFSLICYGSSESNFNTFEIEAQSGGVLCQLIFNESGERAFRVGGVAYSMEHRDGITYDKAIVLRLKSQRGSGQCHVVCAGLSEWGSLAAVHYLTTKWKELHKRFDRFGERRDFCVLLEVPFEQIEKTREIASAVWWYSNPLEMIHNQPTPFRRRHDTRYSNNKGADFV